MSELARRLLESQAGGPLASGLEEAAQRFAAERGADAAAKRLEGAVLHGLARLLASEPQLGAFLGRRPALFERIADAGPETLERRAGELAAEPEPGADLESELDALRLLRREETCLAACLDLGGIVGFPEVSTFLSRLAEAVARRALRLATRGISPQVPVCVLCMGKLAGREFTYHSDLDLVFLHGGGVEAIDAASRIAQRFIAYVTTMTGAGVAYAVDARLRPSGQQGALVTSFEGFERYQTERAETWEHLALLRARPLAGDVQQGAAALARVRERILPMSSPPWPYLAELRARVESERSGTDSDRVYFKTGAGGLMDVDFLAGGGLLERGSEAFPESPSVPALLRAAVRGAPAEALLADYDVLRRVEARVRWCDGRASESLTTEPGALAMLAELLEPGLAPQTLLSELRARMRRNRGAWSAVVAAGSIAALSDRAAGSAKR